MRLRGRSMSDNDLRELLPDYVRGRLDPPTVARVEAAVRDDAALSAECERLRRYYAAIDGIEPVKAPAGFLHRVNARIDRPSVAERFVKAVLLPLQVKLPLGVAGVAAAALLLVVVLRPAEQMLMTRQSAAPEVVIAPPPPAAKADMRESEAVDGLVSSASAKRAAGPSVRGSVKDEAAPSRADDLKKGLDQDRRAAKSELEVVTTAENLPAAEPPTMGGGAPDTATTSALEARIGASLGEFTVNTRNGRRTYTVTMPADRYAGFRRSLGTRWKVTDRTTLTAGQPGRRVRFTVVVPSQQ